MEQYAYMIHIRLHVHNFLLHQILCYYTVFFGTNLHVMVVLVVSPLGFPEDIHGHDIYVLNSVNVYQRFVL